MPQPLSALPPSLSSLSAFACLSIFFLFNDTATTEIYTLSLHDALPIWKLTPYRYSNQAAFTGAPAAMDGGRILIPDRKSTRLNSSHITISYAVFCLKKKTRLPTQPYPVRSARRRSAAPAHRLSPVTQCR